MRRSVFQGRSKLLALEMQLLKDTGQLRLLCALVFARKAAHRVMKSTLQGAVERLVEARGV